MDIPFMGGWPDGPHCPAINNTHTYSICMYSIKQHQNNGLYYNNKTLLR